MNRETIWDHINETDEAMIHHPIIDLLDNKSLSDAGELINQHIDYLSDLFPDYYDFKYELINESKWNHCEQRTMYHYYYNLTALKQGE